MGKFNYAYDPWAGSKFYSRFNNEGNKILIHPLPLLRNIITWSLSTITFILAGLAIIPLFSILWEIISQGLPSLNWQVLTSLPAPTGVKNVPNGFGHAIIGTVTMVGIATMISVPLGVTIGIYLAEFNRDKFLPNIVRFVQRILASIPSIIIGVFAYGLIVFTSKQFSAVAGSFALIIIMLPIIALTTEEALKLVPQNLRLASAALGGNKFQTTFAITLKAALGGITTGCMLAVARASGETAPLIFTALFSSNWAKSIFSATPSLSVLIFNAASSPYDEQRKIAWTAALVLLTLVLVSNIASRFIVQQQGKIN